MWFDKDGAGLSVKPFLPLEIVGLIQGLKQYIYLRAYRKDLVC